MQVELEDAHGRLWPMTYRSVPARYSYEFRAGWKAFAAAWGIATGDAITLSRHTDNRHRLRIEVRPAARQGPRTLNATLNAVQRARHAV
jgi:B3 DNA binding domain